MCAAPVVERGSCVEGEVIPAGGTCTPRCGGNKVPEGSCEVLCPPALTDTPSCTGDIQAGTWWDLCLGPVRDKCANNMQLGTAATASYGSFRCVDPAEATGACKAVAKMAVDGGDRTWDAATLALLACLCLVAGVAAAIARLPMKGAMLLLFKPGPQGWNLANAAAVGLVAAGLVAYAAGLGCGGTGKELVFVLGLAAGLAAPLPLWWACFRAGAHSLVGMSREAAWRIHAAFGNLALAFGVAHGVAVFANIDDVFANIFWAMGALGLLLMLLGVLPAMVHVLKPAALTYDRWKLLHYSSNLGYILAVLHMLDHAVKLQTVRSIVVAAINVLALVVLVAQKVYTKATAHNAVVESADIISDSESRHVILRLHVPSFAFSPGQWGYFSLSSRSMVPHPFTIVPDAQPGRVQLFIKVSGAFTERLADACASGAGALKGLRLEGPYGIPPQVSAAEAVVFVVGGVGVTPALSLLPKARQCCGEGRVRLFWSLRSPALLRRCAPLLEPHLPLDPQCIRLKKGTVDAGEALPLGAQEGRGNVAEWLRSVAADLAAAGVSSALLFVCGEPGLAAAAKEAAASCSAAGLAWQVHVEQFFFLPQSPARAPQRTTTVLPVQVGTDAE